MPSRDFTIDELEDHEVRHGSDAVKYYESADSGRWSEYFTVVFQFDGDQKFYLVHTEEGLTENQQDGMDRNDHYSDARRNPETGEYFVTCPEVELYTETVEVTKFRKLT